MHYTQAHLPPSVLYAANTLYAIQGDIYALAIGDGSVQRPYPVAGIAEVSVGDGALYLNVSRHPDYTVQAIRCDDGALLWSYRVQEGRLTGAPTQAHGMVYANTIEGTLFALRADDGTVAWQHRIDPGSDVPSYNGPFLSASPTIVDGVVYLAPLVNAPLEPFVYALSAQDGALLWKAPLAASPSSPPTVADGVIYFSTHSGCVALRAADGALIWQQEIETTTRSAPVVSDESVYIGLSLLKYGYDESRQLKRRQESSVCSLRAADGELLWRQQVGSDTVAGMATLPAVVGKHVCMSANDGSLVVLRGSDGTPLWRYQTNGTSLSSPVAADDVIYVGANDGYVYALRAADGALLWQTFVPGKITAYSSISLTISAGEDQPEE